MDYVISGSNMEDLGTALESSANMLSGFIASFGPGHPREKELIAQRDYLVSCANIIHRSIEAGPIKNWTRREQQQRQDAKT